jgi:hypothetical protein
MKKKLLVIAAAVLASANVFAQQVVTETETTTTATGAGPVNKRGEVILPQAGEYAIGFSATPILNYVGRLFTTDNNINEKDGSGSVQSPNMPFVGPWGGNNINPGNAIWVKKMIDAKSAYRVRFQFDFSNTTTKNLVAQNNTTPDPFNPVFVEDVTKFKSAQILLGAGIEKRRGASRVQGVYGVEGLIGFRNTSTSIEYGNPLDVNFNAASGRTLKSDPGKFWLVGARGFAGVEYFILPKFSLGGEFGYTLGISGASNGETVTEVWDGTSSSVVEVTTETNPVVKGVGLGLDAVNANINFLFYF